MNLKALTFGFLFCFYNALVVAQGAFQVVPLGVKGGADESNLSAYLVGAPGANAFVCLDAGTVRSGIDKAIATGALKGTASTVLKENIKGYLISHPHLDHVAGMILNSPDDSAKPLYGLPFCLDVIKEKYFSWKSWANFGNEGEKPTLNKYRYSPLVPQQETSLEQTTLSVQAFELSHSTPGQSTAFLIRQGDNYLLYLGDTGADNIEQSNKLASLWQHMGPLIKTKKLKAIFIEVSFPNEQPSKLLFGHLTPALLFQELSALDKAADHSIKGLPVVVTHMKPNDDHEAKIKSQLQTSNSLGVNLIFPEQGKAIAF
ncbi:MBL fold metallo-hydrolase [Chryseolinea lacunae]|uniref:3',5'-cyclic-nucleotide phosphodiesterase n=1 Tax=Chryseolinea lacunae TaxID=2801331 RepID=A0ABS1KJN4_9BACT|nr:3',5'-cyclic-nucleotide phosphodiesterase [Chryseolinea lacunae]MBL0739674.1 3',5'-cyclic-nucleotide phosphodiesterase [Chryseolinea lacunae]